MRESAVTSPHQTGSSTINARSEDQCATTVKRRETLHEHAKLYNRYHEIPQNLTNKKKLRKMMPKNHKNITTQVKIKTWRTKWALSQWRSRVTDRKQNFCEISSLVRKIPSENETTSNKELLLVNNKYKDVNKNKKNPCKIWALIKKQKNQKQKIKESESEESH